MQEVRKEKQFIQVSLTESFNEFSMCDPHTYAGKVSKGCLKCIIKHLLLFAGQMANAATVIFLLLSLSNEMGN